MKKTEIKGRHTLVNKSVLQYLQNKFSPIETKVFVLLTISVEEFTNVIRPLTSKSTLHEVATTFSISKSKVKSVLNKFRELEVITYNSKDELVVSPYVVTYNLTVYPELIDLFSHTHLARIFGDTKFKEIE